MTNIDGHRDGQLNGVTENTHLNEEYYVSYSDVNVHKIMLEDKNRLMSYRKAIFSNQEWFCDKIVLDVGAGTGILSVMCAQAGASVVYAVEASSMADVIQSIAEENDVADKIKVFKGLIQEVTLPTKVDCIISEWMGFYLLHEGMVDSVIFARDKYLKSGGLIYPERFELYAAPCSLPFIRCEDVCGVKMTNFGKMVAKSFQNDPDVIDFVDEESLLTKDRNGLCFDLRSLKCEHVDRIEMDLRAVSRVKSKWQGICIWFDATFPSTTADGEEIILSTAPNAPPTHWKQTCLVFPEDVEVDIGDPMFGEIVFSRTKENRRHYKIEFSASDPRTAAHTENCHCNMHA